MSLSSKDKMPSLNCIAQFYQKIILGYCKSNKPSDIITKSDLYNQFLWGNRKLIAHNKCLMSRSFIEAKILFVKDVLLDDGTVVQNLYDKLRIKQSYLRTISLIQLDLKQYRNVLYAD